MLSGPRLRQVALVARDCARIAGELRQAFGWPPPFRDPGVGRFGLTNAVFTVGDTFVEVVAPAQPDTTAGRYLERRGGESCRSRAGGCGSCLPGTVAARASPR